MKLKNAYFALQNLACARHDIFLQRSLAEMIKKWTMDINALEATKFQD